MSAPSERRSVLALAMRCYRQGMSEGEFLFRAEMSDFPFDDAELCALHARGELEHLSHVVWGLLGPRGVHV